MTQLCHLLLSLFLLVPDTICAVRMFNTRPFGGKVGAPPVPGDVPVPEEKYFEFQQVDHFDGGSFKYWRQRYWINNSTYRPGGPIFLMLGGEEAANPTWMVTGAWQQYAQAHGAFTVLLEHRYYGESRPVEDLATENMKYLSSHQALADTAAFVNYIKLRYYLDNTRMVLFGGSYAGSLAAWMRSKYPYLVDGAVVSSAPLVAMMDFQDYYVGVADVLDTTGTLCRAAIADATPRMYDWWGQADKRELMQKYFRLCHKIDYSSLLDYTVLFNNLAENFAGVVQYNHANRAFEGRKGTNLTVDMLCNVMTDTSRGDTIKRYGDVNSLILDTYGVPCLDIRYNSLARSLNQTSWGSESDGSRQWLWQSCSEFGWFQTSTSIKQPFGRYFTFPWNFTTDQCIDVFAPKIFGGSEVEDNCDETNRQYGGLALPISNVVFINGNQDPWHKISALAGLPNASGDYEIIVVEGTAHCADMYPPSPTDPPGLVAARETINAHIGKWINPE